MFNVAKILSKTSKDADASSAAECQSQGLCYFNGKPLFIGLLALLIFYLTVRWYEEVYGFSMGLDVFAPEFRVYWLNLLYSQLILLPIVFTSLMVYLWKTRDQDLDALAPAEEVKRIFFLLSWLLCYSFATYWGMSFFTEQGGTWHQTVIRDSNFTPTHIVRTYLSYPIFVIIGMGALMYARTRIPMFSKGYSVAFMLVTVGPLMIIPNEGLSEWGHTYWFMEELFVGPMNYGFVFFGWFTLALMGVTSQIVKRCMELWGELEEPSVDAV